MLKNNHKGNRPVLGLRLQRFFGEFVTVILVIALLGFALTATAQTQSTKSLRPAYSPTPARQAGEGDGPHKRLIIRGAIVIDGTGAPPSGPKDIVIEGNRIVDIAHVGYPSYKIDTSLRPKNATKEIDAKYEIGPLFNPPLHRGDERQKAFLQCPGEGGGASINGPPVADPETAILYVTSRKYCTSRMVIPGVERDALNKTTAGVTIADFAASRLQGIRGPEGLPIYKPPYSRITAIDMNTGEHLWKIPVGETPNRIKNHPKLKGMDVGNTGTGQLAPMLATKTLLMYTSFNSEGTPYLFALDKITGQTLAKVALPAGNDYGLMTYVHQGKQYVVLQTGMTLTALALPNSIKAVHAVAGKQTTLNRVFSKEQAKRGQQVYSEHCFSCHSKNYFSSKLVSWHSQPLDKLFDTVSSSMPANNPGSLNLNQYSDVLAYIFSVSGVRLGDKDWDYKNQSPDEVLILTPQ